MQIRSTKLTSNLVTKWLKSHNAEAVFNWPSSVHFKNELNYNLTAPKVFGTPAPVELVRIPQVL